MRRNVTVPRLIRARRRAEQARRAGCFDLGHHYAHHALRPYSVRVMGVFIFIHTIALLQRLNPGVFCSCVLRDLGSPHRLTYEIRAKQWCNYMWLLSTHAVYFLKPLSIARDQHKMLQERRCFGR